MHMAVYILVPVVVGVCCSIHYHNRHNVVVVVAVVVAILFDLICDFA